MAGGGIGEAALLGAAMGGGAAAVTGGDPLKGAMLGGVTGAVGSQFSMLGGGGSGAAAGAAGGAGAGSAGIAGLEGAASAIAANPAASMGASNLGGIASGAGAGVPGALPTTQGMLFRDPLAYIKANPFTAGASGLAGAVGARPEPFQPGEYNGPLRRFRYDPDTFQPTFANGGIAELSLGGLNTRIVGDEPMEKPFASGGIASLGSYSDGGRLLKGPGDGVSDSIPAVIANKQPARLADGEFVVPARIVSELGNGSTDAGARQLYAMMDRIQAKRRSTVGKDKVAVNSKAHKALPA